MALSRAHMSSVIEARGLWKVYETGSNQVQALRGVDLSIEAGEMVAIMGPSGCGKTTLLNCVSSLDEFTAGEVLVDGRQISEMSDRERTKMRAQRLGFVFQSFNLLPVLSAVENVELPLLMNDIAPKEARVRALSALESVGLRDWAGHLPAELSGGEQQRVTIARAFVHEPALILADEPTGNLDTSTSGVVIDLLVDLNRSHGITFLLVTHEEEIARKCTRIVTIRDGLIVSDEQLVESSDSEE
ncbi:MAG: ABC transporter ATP-binding protein [Candidatus Poseidoniales archaeon]|nr:MAG: macrolide ABC transporter ATP-binding protein [Euryarchaeota archaeon]RUA04373.1 MAG: ABC transporter ATP-binding protein [Candidatus Poseidoniales archaeon]